MDFLSTAAGEIINHASSKLSESIDTFKGRHDDKTLAEAIHQHLLEQYGDELFYNDLDSHLSRNKTIENLIRLVRNPPTSQQVTGRTEFVDQNLKRLLNDSPSCLAFSGQIKDIFSHIFDDIISAVTKVNSYSEIGQLQSDLRFSNAELYNKLDRVENYLSSIQTGVQLFQNELASQNLQNYTEKAAEFKSKIENIEKTYQRQNQFEEALSQYIRLALSIADAEIRGDPKDTLLCALRCNIALCHSNLDDITSAMDALGNVSSAVAEKSETYNFVRAAIIVQHHCENQYPEALSCAEKALRLKSDFHRVFFLLQHLKALMGIVTQQDLIRELDLYFSNIADRHQKEKLTADYYVTKGLICFACNNPGDAYENFKRASQHGYNDIVSKFNMLSALYGQAIENTPFGKPVLIPDVDIPKIYDVFNGLRELLHDERIESKAYLDVKRQAIRLYISTSSLLKGSHDLQPLRQYLPFVRDYETTRTLILGSQEDLTPDVIQLLDEDDQLFVELRRLLNENDLQGCSGKIEQRLKNSGNNLPPNIAHILLQLCLINKDPQSYRKYRNSERTILKDDILLAAMDACASELEGDIEAAKKSFDNISKTCMDYHVLRNALNFYKRNKNYFECEELYFRIQGLQKERKIYIDDLGAFCCSGLDFFISKSSNSAKRFFDNSPISELSLEFSSYMKVRIYTATNDAAQFSSALPYQDFNDFQNVINKAICQRNMCRYDEGLSLCLSYIRDAHDENKEQLVKIYWLISDFYLLKQLPDESFDWALKAHQLMEEHPYDQSHRLLLGRSLRCGHFNGISTVMEYQKTHPKVVDYVKAFHISVDDENAPQTFLQELHEYLPDSQGYDSQERQFAENYKKSPIPIHLLSQYYNEDWNQIFQFAHKTKLRLGIGTTDRQQLEASWVNREIVVDAQTLIIMAVCDCLPALKAVDCVHISYSSVATLQDYYLRSNFGSKSATALMKLLSFEGEGSVIFEPDGIITVDDTLVKGFSKEFFAGCNISERLNIPFLCADALPIYLQDAHDFPISKNIRFITLPSLCGVYGKNEPDLCAQMIYQLLQVGDFISFSVHTMLSIIKAHNFEVPKELIQPFLICKSDYDMQSFAAVYLRAVNSLKSENETSAVALSELILSDAARIWRRGTFYRDHMERNLDYKARTLSILKYVSTILTGMKTIWPDMPEQLNALSNRLRDHISDEIYKRQ